jgi:hypothetical protein
MRMIRSAARGNSLQRCRIRLHRGFSPAHPFFSKTIISSTKHSPIRFEKDRLFNLSAIAPVVRVIALMRDRDHTLLASFSIQTTYGQLFVELECFSPVFSRV